MVFRCEQNRELSGFTLSGASRRLFTSEMRIHAFHPISNFLKFVIVRSRAALGAFRWRGADPTVNRRMMEFNLRPRCLTDAVALRLRPFFALPLQDSDGESVRTPH
jgi:hypothetical protein